MKTNIKKRSIDGFFVHNMLCELANGCSAVQSADSLGQNGIISQELYDYVYELIDSGELKIAHGWIMNAHNSVGFISHNESYFSHMKVRLRLLKANLCIISLCWNAHIPYLKTVLNSVAKMKNL